MASSSSSSSFTTIISLSFIFFLLSGAPPSVNGILLCTPVVLPLFPCFAPLFLDPLRMGKPSSLCCLGIASVSVQANTTLGKPKVCQCLKKLMQFYPIITPQKANNATTQCGFSEFFPEVDAVCID